MSYSPRFNDALSWAAELHRHQLRKGKDVPYINHLMGVASLVGAHGGDEDQVIAALLHDAIEDCVADVPDVADQIEARFGPDVLHIVEGCTDAYEDPKPEWKKRKTAYLKHLRELPDDSPILLVSLADKVHNARAIVADLHLVGDELWGRFKGNHEGSIWYYDTLASIFEEKLPCYLSGELRSLVEVMKQENPLPEIQNIAQ